MTSQTDVIAAQSAAADAEDAGDTMQAPPTAASTKRSERLREAFARWFPAGSLRRRVFLGFWVYVICTIAFFGTASPNRIREHTPYNHYALLADAWLHGQLDLRGPPPPYSGNNDFAQKGDKWFISFPPFPAVWMVPWVMLGGYVENVRDGQAFMWLAGVGPAVLFLVFEKLRRQGYLRRREATNFILALLFALGTVYWFTAIQGTVWFAAHVVGVAVGALFLLCAIDAKHPILAGLLIGCAFLTRPPMVLMGLVFATEAVRVSLKNGPPIDASGPMSYLMKMLRSLDYKALLKRWSLFAVPALAMLAVACWHNYARFGDPTQFGHEYLTVAWSARIAKWGLFSYHYLPRNLAIVLTSLPYLNQTPALFQINAHGLALWVTTPMYLWLLWPKKWDWMYVTFAIAAIAVALPDLTYQNSGWMQFGYRFSNDFALLLFVLLALGHRRFRAGFYTVAAVAVAINFFGAISFERAGFADYYYNDGSQKVIFQPD